MTDLLGALKVPYGAEFPLAAVLLAPLPVGPAHDPRAHALHHEAGGAGGDGGGNGAETGRTGSGSSGRQGRRSGSPAAAQAVGVGGQGRGGRGGGGCGRGEAVERRLVLGLRLLLLLRCRG